MTEQAKCILYFVKQVKKLQDDNISDQDATDVVMKSVAHTSAKLIEIQKKYLQKILIYKKYSYTDNTHISWAKNEIDLVSSKSSLC